MNTVDLKRELFDIPYPDEVAPISLGILGKGFFPGAVGSLPHLAGRGGLLLLGQDFGRTDYYESRCGDNDEFCTTWTNVCRTYQIALEGQPVWYSNYLMGARKPPLPATGDLRKYIHSAMQWERFEASCWKFLHAQIEYQRPQLIVVLGGPNRLRLSNINRLATGWDRYPTETATVNACVQQGLSQSRTFPLRDGTAHTTKLTYAFHPCYGQGTAKLELIAKDAQRVAGYWLRLISELLPST